MSARSALAGRTGQRLTFPSRADGLDLEGTWYAGSASRGVLVVAHGLGDHGGRYAELAETLTGQEGLVDVLCFDQRGHGHSPGPRGVVRRYEDLLGDLQGALAFARARAPGFPVFVLGHSNGGQIALRELAQEREAGKTAFEGLILSNPALRIRAKIPWWKRTLGQVLVAIAPSATLDGSVPTEWLLEDRALHAGYRSDPLVHARIQPRLFFDLVDRGAAMLRRPGRVDVPVLVILSERDLMIDAQATEAWFEGLLAPSKVRIWAAAAHEPLFDHGRDHVIERVVDWLRRHLDSRMDTST
jgi:alpha-beta hydrolase superfamily lysophospholipase